MKKLTENSNPDQKTIRILIIEDDPISAAVLESLLRELGFIDITMVTSSKEAIKVFFEKDFDIIFSDINLADSNGIDLTRHYRTVNPRKDTPIICCSTAIEKHRRECIEAGMSDFLDKPVAPDQLRRILECWLPSYRAENFNREGGGKPPQYLFIKPFRFSSTVNCTLNEKLK